MKVSADTKEKIDQVGIGLLLVHCMVVGLLVVASIFGLIPKEWLSTVGYWVFWSMPIAGGLLLIGMLMLREEATPDLPEELKELDVHAHESSPPVDADSSM